VTGLYSRKNKMFIIRYFFILRDEGGGILHDIQYGRIKIQIYSLISF